MHSMSKNLQRDEEPGERDPKQRPLQGAFLVPPVLPVVLIFSELESTSVGSLRRARIFWTSVRHLGRLTDVARAPVSGRTCELRLNDIHGKNAEISPDFQMVSRSGQALGPHPYQPLK